MEACQHVAGPNLTQQHLEENATVGIISPYGPQALASLEACVTSRSIALLEPPPEPVFFFKPVNAAVRTQLTCG
jgi:hypothetical protein